MFTHPFYSIFTKLISIDLKSIVHIVYIFLIFVKYYSNIRDYS